MVSGMQFAIAASLLFLLCSVLVEFFEARPALVAHAHATCQCQGARCTASCPANVAGKAHVSATVHRCQTAHRPRSAISLPLRSPRSASASRQSPQRRGSCAGRQRRELRASISLYPHDLFPHASSPTPPFALTARLRTVVTAAPKHAIDVRPVRKAPASRRREGKGASEQTLRLRPPLIRPHWAPSLSPARRRARPVPSPRTLRASSERPPRAPPPPPARPPPPSGICSR